LNGGRIGDPRRRKESRCAIGRRHYDVAMPIYEFHCRSCEKDSEVLVRSTDWKGTACPHCGSKKLSKKLSVFAAAAESSDELPPCTGNPEGCGRCAMN